MKEFSTMDSRMRGFSLLEVMVAVIIIAVGMLGIAKLQALTLSTTESSGIRSLVAIEAASLASTMHTNRDYWVSGPPPPVTHVTITPTGPGVNAVAVDGALAAAPNCASTTACTPVQMAAYDVNQWGAALGKVVPASLATITCPGNIVPVECTIAITWQENLTSTNNAAAAAGSAAGALNSPVYTLYVEP